MACQSIDQSVARAQPEGILEDMGFVASPPPTKYFAIPMYE